MRWLSADEFAPDDEVDSGNKTFDGILACFWKQKVEADTQKDVGNDQKNQDTQVVSILL